MIRVVLSADSTPASADRPEYRLSPDVLLAVIDDGSSRLLDLGGNFFALPPVSTDMLLGMLQAAPAAVAGQVAARYAADPAQVRADLDRLTDDLLRQRIIRHGDAAVPRNAVRLWLLSIVLPALVRAVTAARVTLGLRAKVLLGLGYLAIRRFGWPATVAAWPALPVSFGRVGDAANVIRLIDEAVRSAASLHLLDVECKERSLVCWGLLRAAGVPAQMVIAIALYPFACHCYCEADGRILTDFADRCERFFPVISYS